MIKKFLNSTSDNRFFEYQAQTWPAIAQESIIKIRKQYIDPFSVQHWHKKIACKELTTDHRWASLTQI